MKSFFSLCRFGRSLERSGFFLGFLVTCGMGFCMGFTSAFGQTRLPAPDVIVLRDGSTVQGLILENTVDAVLLQVGDEEKRISKKDIARIRDEDQKMNQHTMALKPGTLPSWRVIANDLRTQDDIRSLLQIPAVRIDLDDFRRIPYKSFLVNDNMELNIYGNPDRPVGIEIGIFGARRDSLRAREAVRAYLAGFLSSRAEIAALYAVDLDAGEARAGRLTIEVTPPTAPEAEDSWWMSLYLPDELEKARVSEAAYKALTIDPEKAQRMSGRHSKRNLTNDLLGHVFRLWEVTDDTTEDIFDQTRDVFRVGNELPGQVLELGDQTADTFMGFFRDSSGKFRLVPFGAPPETGAAGAAAPSRAPEARRAGASPNSGS